MKENLLKLRKHNLAVFKGDKTDRLQADEVKTLTEETIPDFAKEIALTRQGRATDAYGRVIPAYNISFADAISIHYGIQPAKQTESGEKLSYKQQQKHVVKEFLKQMDIFMGSDTLKTAAARLGNANLGVQSLTDALTKYSQFDALANTSGVPADYRFIIPELILTAIRLDYDASSLHQGWVATTQSISQDEITMPFIKKGNAVARKVGEGESIEFGSVSFGKKKAGVFKVGLGFKITDELIERSSLDMIFTFLGEVGVDMSICADYEAYRVLVNGEQSSGAESAPTIGVATANTFNFKDIKRGTSRLRRLKRMPDTIITGENDGIDITSLPEFQGFNGGNKMATIQSILGVPDTLKNDVYTVGSNQIMLLDSTKAMAKLQYGSMKMEERRNPQTQENEIFVSDYIGFSIIRRDARLIIDKSVLFSAQGFPAYMDIDARINEAFKYHEE
ncbi:MAG TPA: phage major capsid protein [Niabella sp.]|nr:phage major capsid protein [Bacteroidia bacterium]HOZ90987.1 phage major capsid protein [Bacteroidia bacterium]HRB52086.1 phage major capsid protein [Bacteroidia bacterium]HRC03078.1 phage major capsid protein [Niabella sp.]